MKSDIRRPKRWQKDEAGNGMRWQKDEMAERWGMDEMAEKKQIVPSPHFSAISSTFGVGICLLIALSGCTTKSKSASPAQQAFAAVQQQQAMAAMRQNQGPNVTVFGPVRNSIVPWEEELTVAKAIVAADYLGASDPHQIIVVRKGRGIRVDPKQLLKGKDIPLQPGDVIQMTP